MTGDVVTQSADSPEMDFTTPLLEYSGTRKVGDLVSGA